jgi:uncharacterized repeat protein (TIGR01451 family)
MTAARSSTLCRRFYLLACLLSVFLLQAGGARAQCFIICPPLPCLPLCLEEAGPELLPVPTPLPGDQSLQPPMAGGAEDPPTPALAIRVRVPASISPGQDLEYHIEVENRSSAAAHHVLVRNPMPTNARYVRANPEPSGRDPELTWRLGTLDAGARREIVLVLAPTGMDEVKNCARVQFEHGQCVSTKILRPALKVTKSGPTQALLNESLSYKITLTNTGEAELSNLLLTDVLAAGLEHSTRKDRLSWILGTLAPGQSQSVEYQVTAKNTGKLCNKAIATAAGGFREEMESCVTVGEAKLGLSMTGPKKRYLNMPVTYELKLTNPGTVALQNLVIDNPLPAGMTFVSAGEGGQFANDHVVWSPGSMAPGASQTLTVVLQARKAGRICNQAIASADHGLSQQAEFCTDFSGMPALSLEVDKTDDPVEIGATTSYNISVRNQGSSPVTGVRIAATVPEQMQTKDAAGAANHRTEGQKVTYEPITLQAGDAARYRIEVKALRAGDVRFKVELTADQLIAGPVEQQESTTIFSALPLSRRKSSHASH